METTRPQRLTMGAEQRPDGSWDYSRAAYFVDRDGAFAKAAKNSKEKAAKNRAKKLEIPAEVKPGSARMAWYRMRNTIIINEEAAAKARQQGRPDKRREDLIKKQKMQQSMHNNASQSFRYNLIKESLGPNQEITTKQADEKSRDITADEMSNLVQKYVINHYELLQKNGERTAYLPQGALSEHHPIEELLQIAKQLQSRLIEESSRTNSE